MESLFSIKDKVVVLTGGAGVLCATIAKALSQQGAKTTIWDIDEQAAIKLADHFNQAAQKSIAVECDVLNKKSIENAKEKTISELGHIDILINGAGGNKKQATTSEDTSFFDLPDSPPQSFFKIVALCHNLIPFSNF